MKKKKRTASCADNTDGDIAFPFIMLRQPLPSSSSSASSSKDFKVLTRMRTRKNFDPLVDAVCDLDYNLSHYGNKRSHGRLPRRHRGSLNRVYPLSQKSEPKTSTSPPTHPTLSSLGREYDTEMVDSIKAPLLDKTNSLLGQQRSRFIFPVKQQENVNEHRRTQALGSSSRQITKQTRAAGLTCSYNPQHYLVTILKKRGYNTSTYRAMDTSYYNRPTELQQASYGPALIYAVRAENVTLLGELLAHLSANPSTPRGESLWHMVCRSGNNDLFKVLLLQKHAPPLCEAVNEYGRTALHDACWGPHPALDIVQALLDRNPMLLFLEDAQGTLPLSYVSAQHWPLWVEFLDRNADKWFPKSGSTVQYRKGMELVSRSPHSNPLKEPMPLPLEVATRIASGQANMILEWSSNPNDRRSFTKMVQTANAVDNYCSGISDYDDSANNDSSNNDDTSVVALEENIEDSDDHCYIVGRTTSDARSLLGGNSALQMVYHISSASRFAG